MAIFSRYSPREYVPAASLSALSSSRIALANARGRKSSAAIDRLDNAFLEVARMRCREPHPPNPLNVGDGQQQLEKRIPLWRWIGVRIDRLPEKLNFGVAQVRELPDFPQNRIAARLRSGARV